MTRMRSRRAIYPSRFSRRTGRFLLLPTKPLASPFKGPAVSIIKLVAITFAWVADVQRDCAWIPDLCLNLNGSILSVSYK
jgi:hypothetical protein